MLKIVRRTATISAGLLFAAAAATPASASSPVSSNLSVSATVNANCTVSTTPLEFGDFDALTGSAVNGTGGVSVTCTNGTGWTAAASAGGGSGATFATRKLTSGSDTLNYSIFTDAARTTVWGDGSGGTGTIGRTGTGAAQSVTVYGRIAAGQNTVPAGDYEDVVSVTITY